MLVDTRLLKQDAMGEKETDFQHIYATFRPQIARYLVRLGCERDVEDLVQDVFLKVSRSLQDFRGQSKLSTWIYRIATNTALDKLRSPSYQRAAREASSIDASKAEAAEGDPCCQSSSAEVPSLESTAIREEMNECILEFVNNLPENYRTVLLLSELEGFKSNEIAEILGLTLDTVKIRLHRGREMLRNALQSGCHFYRDERNELACDRKDPGNTSST